MLNDDPYSPKDPMDAQCTSTLDNVGSGAINALIGALNFWGLGDALKNVTGWKSPLDKVKDDIQDIYNEIDQFRADSNLALFKLQQSEIEGLLNVVQKSNQDLTASMNLSSELLNEKISMNEIYIIFCYIFCIVLYIYLLFKK